ncbi:hypothetical protein BJ917_2469 [Pseudomonas sp. WPR_5_2]|uniref:hypothetical protein n=1 Tax=Pseudomonas sp. WPR_5_2 TaxID=1907371 RepID=UPI000EB2E9A6|nr:hypothetical protein [Pseudomonas sp. WPR_5_2]RKS23413.1 hypothetical protein BJ917_2469 [Pseudomonas sp. WPR_5_2]
MTNSKASNKFPGTIGKHRGVVDGKPYDATEVHVVDSQQSIHIYCDQAVNGDPTYKFLTIRFSTGFQSGAIIEMGNKRLLMYFEDEGGLFYPGEYGRLYLDTLDYDNNIYKGHFEDIVFYPYTNNVNTKNDNRRTVSGKFELTGLTDPAKIQSKISRHSPELTLEI